MTSSRTAALPHLAPTGPSAPRRGLWSIVGQPVLRQWWFPTGLRPAVLRAFGAEIDDRVVIREQVRVLRPWRLRIDGPAWLGHGVSIDALGNVTIEREVCLGRDVVLGTVPGGDVDDAPIVLRRGAWIAARARVNAGCEVGEHAVVGAGAEVRGTVDPESTVQSSDARAEDAVVRH